MKIGIMQGRLLPALGGKIQCFPAHRWADEFSLAAAAGLESIEWIYEVQGADVNPLASDSGVDALAELSARHGVSVRSVCADYFMDRPLVRATRAEWAERVDVLRWLIERCARARISRVVLPFVDVSAIQTDADRADATAAVQAALPLAEKHQVELHLETSLGPTEFAEFLERLPTAWVCVNYDSGNSASLGYEPREEFAAYGHRVGSIHIKDRVRNGGTVPLGTGDTNFRAVFDGLAAIGFDRPPILQVARGKAGDEVPHAIANRLFVESGLRAAREGIA